MADLKVKDPNGLNDHIQVRFYIFDIVLNITPVVEEKNRKKSQLMKFRSIQMTWTLWKSTTEHTTKV